MSRAERRDRVPRTASKLVWFVAVALLVTTLDLVSKELVFERLGGIGSPPVRVVDGVFELVCHENTGGMWGVGQEWNPWILRVVRLGAVAVILLLLAQTPVRDRWSTVALGLVMGGAIGNVHDSLRFGAVRDFLKFDLGFPPFDPFPTFNLADSAICVGVFLLAIQMLFAPRPREQAAEPAPHR